VTSLQIGRLENCFPIGTKTHVVAWPTEYRTTLRVIQPQIQRTLESLS